MNTKHSQTPWQAHGETILSAPDKHGQHETVAEMFSDGMPWQANAELIVRAVNSREALVAALTRVVLDLEAISEKAQMTNVMRIGVVAHIEQARAALAQAEGKQDVPRGWGMLSAD